ncbi:MAG: hypothetical protein ACR2HG_13605 [Pyrinomonadaceae bacterium]
MKKFIILIIFTLAMCGIVSAQSMLAEFDKVKQVKLLKSTRDDVVKLLGGDSLEFFDEEFFTEKANVQVSYSSGNCSGEYEDWNVPEGKITKIVVTPKDSIQIKDTGIDYSKFRKEKMWGSLKHRYAYYDKAAGIAIIVRNDFVESIRFSPSKKNYLLLCDKAETKKYYSSKNWNRYPEMKKTIIDLNRWADVVNLDLSQTEIIADCDSSDAAKNKSCSDTLKEIKVSVTAFDPENDVLTYRYFVSVGKIIGQGAKVVWDLSGVKAGTYKITAAADDGCGVCGKWITKTVVVKERPDCSTK